VNKHTRTSSPRTTRHRHEHGLALRARTGLAVRERAMISPLIKDRLENPFNFLRQEFQLACESSEPGASIDFLAGRHASSLSVSAPRVLAGESW
jgi:hypothetical protein